MTDKTKKIIAREGLIILGIIALITLSYILLPSLLQYKGDIFDKARGTDQAVSLCQNTTLLLYPVYLLIRFIIWAVRVLTEK